MTNNQNHPKELKDQELTELQKCQQEGQEYLNNWKRAAADLENYRKEETRRVADVLKFGNERIILEVLDIVDNLDMALKHAPPDSPKDWLTGIQQVGKQFMELLKKYGIEKVKTVGEPFDPVYHEAVQMDGEGDTITEELRAGYTMHDKVIRPARVKIGIN